MFVDFYDVIWVTDGRFGGVRWSEELSANGAGNVLRVPGRSGAHGYVHTLPILPLLPRQPSRDPTACEPWAQNYFAPALINSARTLGSLFSRPYCRTDLPFASLALTPLPLALSKPADYALSLLCSSAPWRFRFSFAPSRDSPACYPQQPRP